MNKIPVPLGGGGMRGSLFFLLLLPSLISFLPVCFPFSSPCVLTASLCLFLCPFPFHLPLCANNWVCPCQSFSFFLIVSPFSLTHPWLTLDPFLSPCLSKCCLDPSDPLFCVYPINLFLPSLSAFSVISSVFSLPISISLSLTVCPSVCYFLFIWQFVSYSSFCLSLSVFLSLCICLPLTISLSLFVFVGFFCCCSFCCVLF